MKTKVTAECGARIANASLVAALAVVVLHLCLAGTDGDFAVRVLFRDFARFAVPFFFLISGFLLAGHVGEPGWWRRETMKRVRSLLVPYVCWSALFALYLLVGVAVPELCLTHAFDFSAWWREKGTLLWGLDLGQSPLMLPLWYLRTLFVLVLLSGVLAGVVRRWGKTSLVGFGAVYLAYAVSADWYPELTTTDVGSMLRATFSPEAFFYFAAGLRLRLKGIEPKKGNAVLFLGIAVALLVMRRLLGPWVPYPVVIPFALCGVWCATPATPWPKALTGMAFPIYLIHWFFVHLLGRVCPQSGATPLGLAAACAGVVAATAVVAWGLVRLTPRAAGVLFGGRCGIIRNDGVSKMEKDEGIPR